MVFERQFGTNHLGYFALTGLLLPALKRSAAARVVTVASLAHRSGKIEEDNLQSERSYDPMGAYNNTKLANLLFAYELDRQGDGEVPYRQGRDGCDRTAEMRRVARRTKC